MTEKYNQKLDEIDYFFQKCVEIDKKLGGNAYREEEAKKKKGSELETIEEICRENIFQLKKKIQDRDQKIEQNGRSDPNVIRANIQLKDAFNQANKQVLDFGEKIRIQIKKKKKQTPELLEFQKIQEALKKELMQLQALERGEQVDNKQHQTIDSLKNNLIGGPVNRKVRDPNQRVDPNEIELEAMNRFKENDQIIDQKADLIVQQALEWKKQAIQIGEKQDVVGLKVNQLNVEVVKTNQTIESQNKKLKGLIAKYRAPSKCCLDIVLLLTLIGLITVMINMAS